MISCLLENPYFIKAYTLSMFSFYTQATCTILFQTPAIQLISISVAYRYLELKEMQIRTRRAKHHELESKGSESQLIHVMDNFYCICYCWSWELFGVTSHSEANFLAYVPSCEAPFFYMHLP